MTSTAGTPDTPAASAGRGVSRSQWIVIAMVVGIAAGYFFPAADNPGFLAFAKSVSAIFLRMIKSLIVPLLFSTLVVGIAGHGDDMKKVGKLAFRSIVYFEVVTMLALFIGLAAVNLVKPGAGISLAGASAADASQFAQTKITFGGVIEHSVPQSFFDAAAKNEVLRSSSSRFSLPWGSRAFRAGPSR